MTTAERIADALANPVRYETWRLDLLRSDANFERLYAEEDALRRLVEARRRWNAAAAECRVADPHTQPG